jgi:hypothetical protein
MIHRMYKRNTTVVIKLIMNGEMHYNRDARNAGKLLFYEIK